MNYALIAIAIFGIALVGGIITFFILRNSNNKLKQKFTDTFLGVIKEQQKLDTKEINKFTGDEVVGKGGIDLTSRDNRRNIIATVCDSFRDSLDENGNYNTVSHNDYLKQFCKQYNELFIIHKKNGTASLDRDNQINSKTADIDGLSDGFGTMLKEHIYYEDKDSNNLKLRTKEKTVDTMDDYDVRPLFYKDLKLAEKADDAVTKYNRRQQLITRIGTQALTSAQNITKVYETGSILEIHSALKEGIGKMTQLENDIKNQTPGQPFA